MFTLLYITWGIVRSLEIWTKSLLIIWFVKRRLQKFTTRALLCFLGSWNVALWEGFSLRQFGNCRMIKKVIGCCYITLRESFRYFTKQCIANVHKNHHSLATTVISGMKLWLTYWFFGSVKLRPQNITCLRQCGNCRRLEKVICCSYVTFSLLYITFSRQYGYRSRWNLERIHEMYINNEHLSADQSDKPNKKTTKEPASNYSQKRERYEQVSVLSLSFCWENPKTHTKKLTPKTLSRVVKKSNIPETKEREKNIVI